MIEEAELHAFIVIDDAPFDNVGGFFIGCSVGAFCLPGNVRDCTGCESFIRVGFHFVGIAELRIGIDAAQIGARERLIGGALRAVGIHEKLNDPEFFVCRCRRIRVFPAFFNAIDRHPILVERFD